MDLNQLHVVTYMLDSEVDVAPDSARILVYTVSGKSPLVELYLTPAVSK